MNKVYELIDTEQKPIFTLGPIIHNEGVVADLEARGVHVIAEADLDSPDDTLQNGTVVILSLIHILLQEKAEKEKNHLTYRRRRSQESSLQTEPSWKEMQSSWQPADSLIRVQAPQVTDTASQENWD